MQLMHSSNKHTNTSDSGATHVTGQADLKLQPGLLFLAKAVQSAT